MVGAYARLGCSLAPQTAALQTCALQLRAGLGSGQAPEAPDVFDSPADGEDCRIRTLCFDAVGYASELAAARGRPADFGAFPLVGGACMARRLQAVLQCTRSPRAYHTHVPRLGTCVQLVSAIALLLDALGSMLAAYRWFMQCYRWW